MTGLQGSGRGPLRVHRHLAACVVAGVLGLAVLGCGGPSGGEFSGPVEVDGSSTVFPITEATAEEFSLENPRARVTVGISGTGGGFQRFCSGEIDISNASRPISDIEIERCEAAGIDFIEIPVAYDGLSVVVNPENDWADCLTVEELNLIWAPESEGVITNWSQVRPGFPNAPLNLYGAGTDSGTFDYFTEVINGEAQASRADYTASEDDNILVQGVAGDRNALGYFGFAYLEQNEGLVKAVAVDGSGGCVEPTTTTIQDGTYEPLSRPLFIYVKLDSVSKPQVQGFVDFYLENAGFLAADVGFVAFPDSFYAAITQRWSNRETGSIFSGASGPVAEILGIE